MSHDSHASARPASTPPYAAARPTGMVSPGTQPLRSRALRQQTPLPAVSTFRSTYDHTVRTHPSHIPTLFLLHTIRSTPAPCATDRCRFASRPFFTPDHVPPTDIGISSSIQRQSNVLTSTLQQITSQGWLSDPLPIALDEIYCNNLLLTDIQRSFALNLNLVTIQALVAFSRKSLHDLFAATPQRDLERNDITEALAQLYALGQYLDKLEPTSDGTRASIDVFPSTEPGTNSFLTSRWNMSDFRTATRANWHNLRAAFFDSVDMHTSTIHILVALCLPRHGLAPRTSRSGRLPPRSDHSHGSNSLASSASHDRTVLSNTSDLSSLNTHRSKRSSRSQRSRRSHATSVLSSHASQPDQTLTSRQKASLRLAAKLNPSKGDL